MGRATVIVGNFNTSLSVIYATVRQKFSKHIKVLSNTINELALTLVQPAPQNSKLHVSQVLMEHSAREMILNNEKDSSYTMCGL